MYDKIIIINHKPCIYNIYTKHGRIHLVSIRMRIRILLFSMNTKANAHKKQCIRMPILRVLFNYDLFSCIINIYFEHLHTYTIQIYIIVRSILQLG